MSCIICYDEVKMFQVPYKYCNCKYQVHRKCLNKFKENSNFNCPICRNKKIEFTSYLSPIILVFMMSCILIHTLLILYIMYNLMYR